ncbi:MAG: polysaccharide deacetylase family protein [Bacteroidota bacterium]|nr:polysaccharide deacetylase family protein [Bacteroidota bacterium]
MEIKIGIIGKSDGWESVLSQIGIPFSICSNVDEVKLNSFPIIVLSDDITTHQLLAVKKYIETGGCVICSAAVIDNISLERSKRDYIKYLVSDLLGVFADSEIIDVYTDATISEGASHLKTDKNIPAVLASKFGDGFVVILPFDVDALFENTNSKKKNFYLEGKRLPFENVSLVSKGSLRRLITKSIELIYSHCNLHFGHKWYYPDGHKSVFIFRVDTDYGTEEQVDSLYKLSQMYQIPITWFVDVKSQQKWISKYSEMQNHEIGVHCYEHTVYESYADNYSNIRKALEIMKANGINSKGFAAPFGKWNPALGQAVRDLDFEYSSEFAYDYDNLPSFTNYSTLQIPVHPICIGSLRRQGYTAGEMIAYYENEIEKKLKLNEPIILYHHPTNENIDVVEKIFQRLHSIDIPKLTMHQFAEWWNKREKANVIIQQDGTILNVNTEHAIPELRLRLASPAGKETITASEPSIELDKISWQEKEIPLPLPKDIHRIRKFNIWMLINKIEDYFFTGRK